MRLRLRLPQVLATQRAEEQMQQAVDRHIEAMAAAEEEAAQDAAALPIPKSGALRPGVRNAVAFAQCSPVPF